MRVESKTIALPPQEKGRRNGFAGRRGFVGKTRSWIRKNSDGLRHHRLNSCESSYKPIPAPQKRAPRARS